MDHNTSPVPEAIAAILDELEASYWVPALGDPFRALHEVSTGIQSEKNPLREPFKAFVSNLESVKKLLEFPYNLLQPFVLEGTEVQRRLRKFSKEELERALDDPGLVEEVFATGMKTSQQHFKKQQGVLTRLMHQGSLLAWAAFETFCKEVFIAVLNRRPSLYAALLRNQQLKERFGISSSSWPHLLEQHDYDLNGHLGTILGADRDFSSPQLVRDLFPLLLATLPGPDGLEEAINSEHLWLLGNRRHLIAHRCGIVDVDYLRKCNDPKQAAGELLVLRGRDLAQGLGAVARASILLYAKARYCWHAHPSN